MALFLSLFFFSCTRMGEKDVIGSYKIDKFISRDESNQMKELMFLNVLERGKFELFSYDSTHRIYGDWRIIETNSKAEAQVEFSYSSKKIVGKINNTVFSFSFPNEFHEGKYENLLYVKLYRK